MPVHQQVLRLSSFLPAGLSVDAPDVVGGLAVFPLLGAESHQPFLSFAEAAALGARVTELVGGASVNDLLVHNPLDTAVLLYEGEEVVGAQQDRTFDTSVLVPAGATLTVPVSCVEHGRWDGSRHAEAFAPSPQTAYPEMRRRKNAAARAEAVRGRAARADQGAVWDEVDRRASELDAHAPTGAMQDVFAAREEALAGAAAAVVRRPGQLGAVAVAGGVPLVCDRVGRAEAFAALHGPLVRGYALDALSAPAGRVPDVAEVESWLAGVLAGACVRGATPGAGEALHFASPAAQGSALAVGGELVQLCAFPAGRGVARSVRRPSRRAA